MISSTIHGVIFPFPRYDPDNGVHCRLAHLCEEAEQIAGDWLREEAEERPYGQVAASKRIRAQLREEGVLDRIDDAVRAILPDHAEGA